MTQPTQSTQAVYIGVEADYGVAVVPNKRLLSCGFDIKPEETYDEFTPMGYKFPTIVGLIEDWSSGTIEGRASFDEMLWPLASVIGSVPASGDFYTQVAAATGDYPVVSKWAFEPNFADLDTPLSYTVWLGNDLVAEQITGALISEFGITVDRSASAAISGALIGQNFVVPVPGWTESWPPTDSNPFEPVIAFPPAFDLYLDSDFATFSATPTLLEACRIGDMKITNRWGPFWAINSSLPSFSDKVELLPTVTFTLTMSADYNADSDLHGWGILSHAKVGDTMYVKMTASGSEEIQPDYYPQFSLSMACKVNAVPAKGYNNNVVELGWQFTTVFDPTAGYAFKGFLQNALAATVLDPPS